MSKSRYTEAKMIGALKQLEAGRKAEDVTRGAPRLSMIASSARATPRLAKLVSTSKAKRPRVYASTTLSSRIACPQSTVSKQIAT